MDLDFYEVRYPSALIAFTDRSWSEVLSTLQTRACADVADKRSDYRVSEDVGYQYVMIAFNDQITNQCEYQLNRSVWPSIIDNNSPCPCLR